MQKKVLAIHDISCVGRCSLTVALPILSAAGLNTSVIPTALLSTHTGEFSGYTHLDLSDQLLPIAEHLASLQLPLDAFYSGYLASPAQVTQIKQMMDMLCGSETHIFVDPAFADHGKLYALMSSDMPRQMRCLCACAHTIVPNFTEASFLLGKPYQEVYDRTHVASLTRELAALGPENVVISDISFDAAQTGIAVFKQGMGEPEYFFTPRYDGTFHGTGDVFASLLLAGLLSERSLMDAAQLALSLTHESILLTLEDKQPLRYGVQFERILPALMQELQGGQG